MAKNAQWCWFQIGHGRLGKHALGSVSCARMFRQDRIIDGASAGPVEYQLACAGQILEVVDPCRRKARVLVWAKSQSLLEPGLCISGIADLPVDGMRSAQLAGEIDDPLRPGRIFQSGADWSALDDDVDIVDRWSVANVAAKQPNAIDREGKIVAGVGCGAVGEQFVDDLLGALSLHWPQGRAVHEAAPAVAQDRLHVACRLLEEACGVGLVDEYSGCLPGDGEFLGCHLGHVL
jgi:hypothetical protein